MDYKTKPTSRKDLRRYAKFVRRLFDVPQNWSFSSSTGIGPSE